MYAFLLDVTQGTTAPLDPERLGEAGIVLLRGMLTIFAVLCIVWLFLAIVRFFVYDLPKMRDAKNEPKPTSQTQTVAPAPAATHTDERLLVAILTAAVAAARENEGYADTGFRVVSFNRIKK